MARDDEYISSIRAFQRRFYAEFVDSESAPPEDFFFEGAGAAEVDSGGSGAGSNSGGGGGGGGGGGSRSGGGGADGFVGGGANGDGGGGGEAMSYARFLERTLELSAAAELVRHIPNKEVQRGASEPLFNDHLVKGGGKEGTGHIEVDW